MWLILKELGVLYTAIIRNTAKGLKTPYQFSQYAIRQHKLPGSKKRKKDEQFWQEVFTPPPAPLDLPTTRKRPAKRSFKAGRKHYTFAGSMVQRLKSHATQEQTTLKATLLTAFSAFLSRISRQNDPVIGVSAVEQATVDHPHLVGHCVNLLAIRCPLTPEDTFSSYLHRYKSHLLDAFDHQDYSYGSLLKKLNISRDTRRPPLVPILFTVDQRPEKITFDDLEVEYYTPPREFEIFEISVNTSEIKGKLYIECQYNRDLFSSQTITNRLLEFEHFLKCLINTPQKPLTQIPLIPSGEQKTLVQWNTTSEQIPAQGIHQLFEQQARRIPGKTAVIFADSTLTYNELNQRANSLAVKLQQQGLKHGALVGVFLPRSPEMVIAIVAILKAGFAYVPLDPNYPEQRIKYMVTHSAMQIVLTSQEFKKRLPDPVTPVCIDTLPCDELLSVNSTQHIHPDDTAYVIYTSGSTGNPKGVQVHHRAVVNFLTSMSKCPGMRSDDVLLAVTTLSFDIAVLEIFLPLTTGASLVLATTEETTDGFLLQQLMYRHDITIMQATPATWHMLLATGWQGLKNMKILCGGEPMPMTLAKQLLTCCKQLWNMYGPTETTIWSTCYRIKNPQTILIGKPINNTEIYLLDNNQQPVPIGVPAELCIGGAGVSKGYLHREDLTCKQFIANPTKNSGKEIIYKTGDVVRLREDGNLEYINRLDNQIKIRGFRIEPGEIETALENFPGVERAAITVLEASSNDNRLAAFFTARHHTSVQKIRAHLQAILPGYMVPQYIVQLQDFPLTPAGKIDRKSLSLPHDSERKIPAQENKNQPQDPTEKRILAIWKDLLPHTKILPDDNFFDIGGHSLLATQAVALLRKEHYSINLRHFFEFPTIQTLAKFLNQQKRPRGDSSTLTSHGFLKTGPLSLQQRRLWYLDKLGGQGAVYNLPAGFRLLGKLEYTQLEHSIQAIIDRHESLRTTIIDHGDSGQQNIAKEFTFSLPRIDLSKGGKTEQERKLHAIITDETAKPFTLNELPLFKAILFILGPHEHVLYFMPHHAIWDGWSFDIFLHELQVHYESSGIDRHPLPQLPVQYGDFARWQQQWLKTDELKKQLSYWKHQLQNDLVTLDLPTDNPRPAKLTYTNGKSESFQLSLQKTDQLTAIARAEQATLFMILLTAYGLLLNHYSGSQKTILIGVPISGRNNQETTDLIGFFVNTLIIKIQLDPEIPFNQLLANTRETCLNAFRHQEIPFEKLIEALNPQRDTSRSPVFQVLFSYQDVRNRKKHIGSLKLEHMNIPRAGVQTDIDFWAHLSDDGISGGFEYNGDLFSRETIQQMINHYHTLLESILNNPNQPIRHISLLKSEDITVLANEQKKTNVFFNDKRHLPQLVDYQASLLPHNTALTFNDTTISYLSLTEQSNQWAHYLIGEGVQKGDIVGICMDRSNQMVVCLLAILKAGAAYLPLDPSYPKERLAYMVEHSKVKIILTEAHLQETISGLAVNKILADRKLSHNFSINTPGLTIAKEDPAYIIYTSGSTGRPKGVQVPHRALSNFLHSMSQRPGISKTDRLLAVTTLSFDIAALELFLPLINGALCHIADRKTAMDGVKIAQILDKQKITFMQATPSTWRMLISAGWQGDNRLKILCGGESFPQDLAARLLPRCRELWNMYGPTETTIWSTCYQITDNESPVLIGQPIANTQVYVLNEHLQPVPSGVTGELYIGGTGVSHGYLNNADLTKKQFIPSPFSGPNDEYNLLYRTGDLVRRHKDGNLEYINRIDNQVKVRGYRIELGEIENALNSHPAVDQAVVITRQEQDGDIRLIAYIICKSTKNLKTNKLKDYLLKTLPIYMVPQHFVSISSLPLTPAGKIDRKELALREIDHHHAAYIPPESTTEQNLSKVWCNLLHLPQVSIDETFFDAGGHSLLAVRLFVEIKNIFQVELPLATLFQAPTIHTLAERIDAECFLHKKRKKLNPDDTKEEFVF